MRQFFVTFLLLVNGANFLACTSNPYQREMFADAQGQIPTTPVVMYNPLGECNKRVGYILGYVDAGSAWQQWAYNYQHKYHTRIFSSAVNIEPHSPLDNCRYLHFFLLQSIKAAQLKAFKFDHASRQKIQKVVDNNYKLPMEAY